MNTDSRLSKPFIDIVVQAGNWLGAAFVHKLRRMGKWIAPYLKEFFEREKKPYKDLSSKKHSNRWKSGKNRHKKLHKKKKG
jgi:hypothetical protein